MLKNRILAGWITAFSIGIGIGLYFDGKTGLTIFACLGVLCGLLLAAHFFCKLNLKKILTVSVLVFVGLAYSAVYSVFVFSDTGGYNRKKDRVKAEIIDIGNFGDSGYFDISVIESEIGVEKGRRVRLYYSNDNKDGIFGLRRYDIIESSLTYKEHNNKSLYSKNITLTAQGIIIDSEAGKGFFRNLRNDTEKIVNRMFKDYPDNVSSVAKTLVLGESGDMDPYIYELFRNAGLSHLLVISGLHISIIVMSLYSLLEFLTVSKRIRSIVCLFVLFLYAFFVGFSPSVTRAAIMTGIMLVCTLATRRADSITSLFFALFVLLLYNPYNLFSLSLELSFLSCLGILILSPYLIRSKKAKISPVRKIIRIAALPMLFALAATVFTFPILLNFSTVSYITPLANLLVTPVFTFLLVILVPGVFVCFITGSSEILAFLPGNIIKFTLNVLDAVYETGVAGFSTYIPYITIPLLLSLSVILSLCFFRGKKMYIAAGTLSLCFFASVVFCNINFNNMQENRAVVAYNDGFLYNSLFIADRKNSLYIDMGGRKSGVSAIYKHGYCDLDCYVMTALSDEDETRLENALSKINIFAVYIPKESGEYRLSDRIKKLAKQRNCDIIEYNKFINKNVGRASVEIKSDINNGIPSRFTAEINRDDKSIKLYSGLRSEDKEDFGFNDAVITTSDFTDPYTDIFCVYRCLKLSNNTPPESRAGAERIYDFTESEYIRIEITDKSVEVDTDEP